MIAISYKVRIEAEVEGKRIYENNIKRQRPADQLRGDKELEYNILGVMGELAVCEILKSKNRNFIRNKSEVDYPVKEADIILDGTITIDVKSHSASANEWRTNLKQFNDESKKSDFYWFIKFHSFTKVQCAIFTRQEVSEWEIKELKYSKALCKSI